MHQSESESESEEDAEIQQKVSDMQQSRQPQIMMGGGAFGRQIPSFEQQEEDNKFDNLVATFLQQYLKAEVTLSHTIVYCASPHHPVCCKSSPFTDLVSIHKIA